MRCTDVNPRILDDPPWRCQPHYCSKVDEEDRSWSGELIWYLVVRTVHAVRWQILVQKKGALLDEAPTRVTMQSGDLPRVIGCGDGW